MFYNLFFNSKFYNLKKEFLILFKSNFFLMLFLTFFIYIFFYYFIFNIKIKIYMEGDQKIKKIIAAYLSDKDKKISFIENSDHSDLILILNTEGSSKEIWDVNIKVNNLYAIKIIPIINYVFFKVYFTFHNKVEPINFYIDLPKNYIMNDFKSNFKNNFKNDLKIDFKIGNFLFMIKNFIIWMLFSYLFFDIYSEKKNKTILIYLYSNNLFNFILSKIFVLSLVLGFILLIFGYFINMSFNIFWFLLVILNFVFLSFILSLFALIMQNKYYINLINMFLGIITILVSSFNQVKLLYLFSVFINYSLNLNYIQLILLNLVLLSLVILVFFGLKNVILLRILKEVD